MIEVRDLVKRYGPNLAVDHVSFDVPRGEVLGFLGPNGAGKTTTMRVLTCYLPADGGTARVAGHDVFEQSVEVRKKIGYLPESAPLYLDMGVVEYLEFVAGMRSIPRAETPRRIRSMIDACGLGPMLKKDISQLSKGYRQRVGLAATLLHDPDVLVLDEPTSGLDPNQIIEIRALIRELGRQKTVILSTHILPEVEATCSKVLIINEGKLVAQGTPEELVRRSSAGHAARASFKAPPAEVEPKLERIEGVEGIRPLDRLKEGTCRYEITWSSRDGMEEQIFRCAVENGWVMTELHTETLSLEQVFTRLTVGEK